MNQHQSNYFSFESRIDGLRSINKDIDVLFETKKGSPKVKATLLWALLIA